VAASAERLRGALPEDQRAQAEKIKAAFATAECGALCRM